MNNVVDKELLEEGLLKAVEQEKNKEKQVENDLMSFVDLLTLLEPLEEAVSKMQNTPFNKGGYKTLLKEVRHKTVKILQDQYKWMNSFKESNISEFIMGTAKANAYLLYMINQQPAENRAKIIDFIERELMGKVDAPAEENKEENEVSMKLTVEEQEYPDATQGQLAGLEEPEEEDSEEMIEVSNENTIDSLNKLLEENSVNPNLLNEEEDIALTQQDIVLYSEEYNSIEGLKPDFASYIVSKAKELLEITLETNIEKYSYKEIIENEQEGTWIVKFALK